MPSEFSVSGVVVERGTGRPLPGLVVRAYDKDRLYDDLLGEATTDDAGRFELRYAGEDFQELFDKRPDIYFRVLDASGAELYSTEDAVRWGAGVVEDFSIEVPAVKTPVAVVKDVPTVPEAVRDGGDDKNKNAAEPYLRPTRSGGKAVGGIKVGRTNHPLPRGTLGDLGGLAAEVAGPEEFPQSLLIQPFTPDALTGIDPTTVRVFRLDEKSGALKPVWNSGINYTLGFTWAKITRPGTYVPVGLPRDRLLREMLRQTARERVYQDAERPERVQSFAREKTSLFGAERAAELEGVRQFLAAAELQTGVGAYTEADLRVGRGGHPLAFPLPGGATAEEFQRRLEGLELGAGGLPEEALFFTPEKMFEREAEWTLSPSTRPLWERVGINRLRDLAVREDLFDLIPVRCLFSPDWWMYHHDERHGGRASGCSAITSTSVGSMVLYHTVPLPDGGSVVTIPSVVDGKIYVGTYRRSGATGNEGMYRINLATGAVEAHFPVPLRGSTYADGIGGSPAVVGGRVYFSHMPGEVYCIDAATFAQIWRTDLRNPDQAQNQPVRNPEADCFSSPLVVNGKVYVGCGEGEYGALGFIYCLDADTGRVVWLFCTCQLPAQDATGAILPGVDVDNSPNVIPAGAAVSNPLPAWAVSAGFSIGPNPLEVGASVWSSCAYDSVSGNIYAGTGNITGDNGLPDDKYGSGAIALDAETGAFRGFLSPAQSTSYKPTDVDVDVPAAPTVFSRGGQRFVAIGSKNGSFFLLDPETMAVVRDRQLLPKDAVTGALIPTVDPHVGFPENKWGVMATAAVHTGLGIIYVGLGGYSGIDDYRVTPFLRALDWETLEDAWVTEVEPVGANQVSMYVDARPPLYTNPHEAGLSSPAVVNDVVFVTTSTPVGAQKANLYALDAGDGHCLWAAPTINITAEYPYCLGPAVYGSYVVIGAGNRVYIYKLSNGLDPGRFEVPMLIDPLWRIRRWPDPPPDWGLLDVIRDLAQGRKA